MAAHGHRHRDSIYHPVEVSAQAGLEASEHEGVWLPKLRLLQKEIASVLR